MTFVNSTGTNGWTCAFAAADLVCHERPIRRRDGLERRRVGHDHHQRHVNGGATAADRQRGERSTSPIDGGPGPTRTLKRERARSPRDNTAYVTTSVGGSGFDLVIVDVIDTRIRSPGQTADLHDRRGQRRHGGRRQRRESSDRPAADRRDVSSARTDRTASTAPPTGGQQIICTGDLPGGGDTTITVTVPRARWAPPDGSDADRRRSIRDDVFTETDEGNNEQTEITTVSGDTCTGTRRAWTSWPRSCRSPDPVATGGTVT